MHHRYTQDSALKLWRDLYFQKWKRNWPHDDNYLRELVRESDSRRELLELMRLDHIFNPNQPELKS